MALRSATPRSAQSAVPGGGTAAGAAAVQPGRPRPGADWYRLWSANALATVGAGALLVAMPLIATRLTADPLLIAAVPVFGRLPWLLFSLPAGALVDRLDRRAVMVGAQCCQAVMVALLALAVTVHIERLWMLYLLAFGITTADTLFGTASQTIVPHVVGDEQLESANGRIFATQLIGEQTVGPAVGAALVAVSLSLPLWLDALTFVLSFSLLRMIGVSGRSQAAAPRRALRSEIAEGVRWLARHRLLRTLTVTAAASNLCGNMYLGTLVLFSRDVLHQRPSGYGLLLTAMALGGALGGLFARRIVRLFNARNIAMAMQVVLPVCWLGVGLLGRNLVTVGVLGSLAALSVTLWNVVVTSLRQRLVPDGLRGRVNGVGRLVAFGAIPLGYLFGGLIAEHFGLIAPWIVAGVLRLAVSALTLPALYRWY